MFRVLPTHIHGALDYLVGLTLVIVAFALGKGAGPQTWLPVLAGGGLIIYTMLTESETGVVPLIGMTAHLLLDWFLGLFLACSPWLLGFAYLVWAPHFALGMALAVLAVITRAQSTRRSWDAPRIAQAGS